MKVRQVMKTLVASLRPDDTALDAMHTLFRLQISGLPVIDSDGILAGMFTEKNILAHLLPSYINKVGTFVYAENPKSTKKKLAELSHLRVDQLMRRDVAVISEDATLCQVAHLMLTQHVRRMPVVDARNKVVGMIARCDILRAMSAEDSGG